ncbi:enoyl-CoA hydratase/isomerase family protein [Actinomycetes bacterium KLBMP 9759]
MSDLLVERDGPALHVTFNRPKAHNALTFAMYEGVHDACETADADPDIRVLVLRGAGGKAFVSGTDIAQFVGFDGQDGIAYEKRITRVLHRLEDTRVPTVAAVDGYCIGGGLAIAAVCDLRIATAASRFGVPIARTLGNCLSMDTHALLVGHLGPARTLDMLLRARLLDAGSARAAGFVTQLVDAAEGLDAAVADTVTELAANAPLSMWAAKQSVARLRRAQLPEGDDIVSAVYASADFAAAVHSFAAKERPTWTGR